MSNLSFCISVALYLLCNINAAESNNNSSGAADLADSCKNFSALTHSLLEDQTNKISLSLTFFPLQDNPPEFVKVTYNFGNTTEPQVWFWSAQTSHFLHPFEVFQFMSLLFSKPEPYYRGEVNITLPSECAVAGNLPNGIPKLQLLTQRLKLYAQRGEPSITVSDTYSAKAYNSETLRELLEEDAKHTNGIIFSMAFIVVFVSILVVVMIIVIFYCSNSHSQPSLLQKVQNNLAAVLSLTMLSFILTLYILSLALCSVHYWNYEIKTIQHLYSIQSLTNDNLRNIGPIYIVFAVDLACTIGWFGIVIFAFCIRLCTICTCMCAGHKIKKSHTASILSLTVLCPSFCIIAHSPYIAIAYLNDGSHASSIFIYYSVLCYILFFVMWLFFHWCLNYHKSLKKEPLDNDTVCSKEERACFKCFNRTTPATRDDDPRLTCFHYEHDTNNDVFIFSCWRQGSCNQDLNVTEECKSCCHDCCLSCSEYCFRNESCCCSKCCSKCCSFSIVRCCCSTCYMSFLGLAILLLIGLIVTISCYFVLIPINKAISDAPNRLFGIYESGGFAIGSVIIYKLLKYFYGKKHGTNKQEQSPTGSHTHRDPKDEITTTTTITTQPAAVAPQTLSVAPGPCAQDARITATTAATNYSQSVTPLPLVAPGSHAQDARITATTTATNTQPVEPLLLLAPHAQEARITATTTATNTQPVTLSVLVAPGSHAQDAEITASTTATSTQLVSSQQPSTSAPPPSPSQGSTTMPQPDGCTDSET